MSEREQTEALLVAMPDEALRWVASRANALLAQRRQDTESREKDRMHDRARPPKAGEPGESMFNVLVSTVWPGLYFGRCRYCTAFILAEKRAPHCDRCEESRRWAEANSADRAALEEGGERG